MALTKTPTYGKTTTVPKKKVVTPKAPGVLAGAAVGAGVGAAAPKATPTKTPGLAAPVDTYTPYQNELKRILGGMGLSDSSVVGVGNYVPPTSYQGDLTADAEWQLGQNTLTNTQNRLAQARGNAFKQAFIGAGFAPGTFQAALAADPNLREYSSDIDADAISAAAANQMSTRAQLDRSLS